MISVGNYFTTFTIAIILIILNILIIVTIVIILIILKMKIPSQGATAWLEAKVTDNGAVEDNDDWKVSFNHDDGDWTVSSGHNRLISDLQKNAIE